MKAMLLAAMLIDQSACTQGHRCHCLRQPHWNAQESYGLRTESSWHDCLYRRASCVFLVFHVTSRHVPKPGDAVKTDHIKQQDDASLFL